MPKPQQMSRRVPDKVFLILETAIDQIYEEIGEENMFRGPMKHLVEREFRFMFREKFHEYMRNRRPEHGND